MASTSTASTPLSTPSATPAPDAHSPSEVPSTTSTTAITSLFSKPKPTLTDDETPVATRSTTPAPDVSSVLDSPSATSAAAITKLFSKPASKWTNDEMRALFPAATKKVWSNFNNTYIDGFTRAHVVGTSLMQHWRVQNLIKKKAFKDFEDRVAKECTWTTALTAADRQKVWLKLIHLAVLEIRESTASTASNKRKRVETEDGGEIARREAPMRSVEKSVKEENVVAADFVSLTDLVEESVPATSLHLRLSRRLGGIHPTLSYQTQLDALTCQSYALTEQVLFKWLDFQKLNTAAKLYLGFNIKDELLAIDYGTEQKPEWLFIQDDASFRSTIKTWHMQHPKTMIVEVMLSERPGFIPYRTRKDLKGALDEEQSEDELESDDSEDDEDDEMEEEETTGGKNEK